MNSKTNPKTTFLCFRCGVCCSLYQVHLDLPEMQKLTAYLNISPEDFIREYTDPRWPGEKTFLIRHRDGSCVFLERYENNNTTGCRIHSFRPQDCRDWAAGLNKHECRRGLSLWGIEADSSGNMCGSADDIKRFDNFLKSLL